MNITTYYMNIIKKLSPQLLLEAQAFADEHSDYDVFHVDRDFPMKDSSAIAAVWVKERNRLKEENLELRERLTEAHKELKRMTKVKDMELEEALNRQMRIIKLAHRKNNSARLKQSAEMWTLTKKGLPKDGCLCWIYTKDSNIAPARYRLHSLYTQGFSDRRAFECDFSSRAYPVSEVVSWIYMKRPSYPHQGSISR